MALSPMMQQYFAIKEKYPDTLLFFRLGDFYEMFFDDAVKASKILDLFLTGRDCGLEERAPMCGVPFHAVDSYVAKLIENGEKVAICEQMTLPEKGIAPREVVRVITPGTVMESSMLDPEKNNYLLCAVLDGSEAGVAWADISTGEFHRTSLTDRLAVQLNDVFLKINPSEIICDTAMKEKSESLSCVKYNLICSLSELSPDYFSLEEAKKTISSICKDSDEILKDSAAVIRASGALLKYITETQKRKLDYIRDSEDKTRAMIIDAGASKTLEILYSSDGKKSGSLYSILNKTKTGMGARLLGKWLSAPPLSASIINKRLDSVGEIIKDSSLRNDIMTLLGGISDMERLAARLSYGNITPKEMLLLASSAIRIPQLIEILNINFESARLKELTGEMNDLSKVASMISAAISEKAPLLVRDGGVIKDGYNAELDEYRSISRDSKSILAKIEATEKDKTGIKSLRIGFNNVFGYYIEVLKSQGDLVPSNYIRKQTLVNCERYITEELKGVETKILHAEENALALEQKLYSELIRSVSKHVDDILSTASVVAEIDVLFSFGEVSVKNNYSRPYINEDIDEINIKEGRHPIVEKIGKETFVPNNTFINSSDSRIMIITGPNMAGKSVYMRQVALICVMAHIGCFVPAESASIPIIDRLFTRVGASDDLHTGRSTFMVEMSEVSYILENITDNSLVLLDEVGRGTATYDGLSIAWAIMEYLSASSKAKTLFSTHYHELTELEGILDGVKNYKMTVREINNTIVFVRKILRGSANRSFGVEVAALAGLPQSVVDSAKRHLERLNFTSLAKKSEKNSLQMSIFNMEDSSKEIVDILREISPDDVSPRMALEILTDLVEKAKKD
ncbi:MAG: DNA mismatch repair protein MutS [Clostridia bacterium]|nr:DNA mismatch repair protein MutS [Clostridia bacterium]